MTALPKASVDMSFDKLTGWSATGATLKDVGRTAELTANGSATTQLASIANFNSKQEGRVRVIFTVHAIKTDVRCRSFINPIGAPGIIYGNWKTVPHNHTLTVSADLQMAVNTAFAVGIDIASYPNAGTLPAGVKVNINQVAVDYARRQKR